MSRISSQIGDSSDGEDYDETSSDEEEERKQKYLKRLYKNVKNKESTASWILKELGNQLLQSREVRNEYKNIKTKFTKSLNKKDKEQFEYLDEEIGRSNLYEIMKSYKSDGNLANEDGDYLITKSEVEKACEQETKYKALETDIEKLYYYLNKKVKYYLNFKEINELNKKVYKHKKDQRESTELKFENKLDDASLFLAKVKGSKKLDRDLGKIVLYDRLYGNKKEKKLDEYGKISKVRTQTIETLSIFESGSFSCLVDGIGKYSELVGGYSNTITNYLNDNPQNSWKKIVKKYLRGQIPSPHPPEIFRSIIQLIFSVEVKRNSATLITAPMFFELVDEEAKETRKAKAKEAKEAREAMEAKKYKIENIATKFPMAMVGAVPASVRMDLTPYYGARNLYDYRDHPADPSKCEELKKRDNTILKDYFINLFNIDVTNNDIYLECFNDLIEDWYGINLDHLNSNKTIKIVDFEAEKESEDESEEELEDGSEEESEEKRVEGIANL